MSSTFRMMLVVLGLVVLSTLICAPGVFADDATEEPKQAEPIAQPAVMIEFHEPITPLSGELLKRRIEQAKAEGVKIIVLDIDSPGGYVSTTLEIVDLLEASDGIQTVAYIENEAISGAALIALATDTIVMAPHALIGDAGMIMMGEDAAFRYVPEKERSYLAQRIRTIAEKSGRPASLAEAMIDKDLVIFKATNKADGTVQYFSQKEWSALEQPEQWDQGKPVQEAGKNTFFTAKGSRAVELGIANLCIEDRSELSAAIGAIDPIPVLKGTWVDTLIFLLNRPVITGILLVLGLVTLVIELHLPGIGLGGLMSIFCFGLFFWSRFLGGTSGWFEVILFVIGLTFVMLEILVIPGIGVAGIGGAGLMIASLVMASRRVMMPESSRDMESLMVDVATVLGSLVGFAVVLMVLSRYLGELPMLSRLALTPPSDDMLQPVPSLATPAETLNGDLESLSVGDNGISVGPLRPSGRVRFGEWIVDVATEGDFVDSGIPVRIVGKRGVRITVRPVV